MDELRDHLRSSVPLIRRQIRRLATARRSASKCVDAVLRGMFCEHRRMRIDRSCAMCNERGHIHGVVCPDCGLTWGFGEGVYG